MKKTLTILIVQVLLVFISFFIYDYFFSGPRIAFVRSGYLIQECDEIKESNKILEEEIKTIQTNLDTLQRRYFSIENAKQGFKSEAQWRHELGIAKNEFEKYKSQSNEQIDKRRNELSTKAINRINEFIKAYGKEHNYYLILGTTQDGSVLYGEEKIDLTEQILKELNKK